MNRRASMLVVLALMLCGSGCASSKWVTLRKTPKNPLSDSLRLLAPGGPQPTDRTMQHLRRYDLVADLMGNRLQLLHKLHDFHVQEPSEETVYAMSELAYLGGKQSELIDETLALDLYGTSVMYAYLYLFADRFPLAHNPYDPRFRGACELYNAALEGTLRIARKQGSLRPGQACTIKTTGQQIDVSIVLRSSGWHPEDFDGFEFVSDYQVNGLKNHYHSYGLGVPLIARRKNHAHEDPTEQFYPRSLSFPVTAFLRVLPDEDADGSFESTPRKAVLELHDPLVHSNIEVHRRRVPLESDLSTPLAYFLSQPEFDENRLSTDGLLNPDKAQRLTGLYMLEPYQAGKIPVVMVHGLWSSPVTWMEMFNDLRSAPEIRKYYQFWFYLYPTGQPFWFSAAQMREDLNHVRMVLDAYHQQPALDQMILVGHSMGGLVSKLQTVDSGNDFWRIMSDKRFEELKADAQVRDSVAKTVFFQPNSSIARVIMIGTPHRGTRFANDLTRWLGRKLIDLPLKMIQSKRQLLEENPGYFHASTPLDIQTSIDSLAPDSPYLHVLLTADTGPWVHYHNILGSVPQRGLSGQLSGGDGDGVVNLASARLENVDSQLTVAADHSRVHRHPRSILEVRRILLEHLNALRSFAAPVQRTPATATLDLPSRRNRQTYPAR